MQQLWRGPVMKNPFLTSHTPRGGWPSEQGLSQCARPACTASQVPLESVHQDHVSEGTRGDISLFSVPGSALIILIPSFCS